MAKLFCGNLPFSVTETDLQTCFSQYGEVRKVYVPIEEDGRIVGFAFAEMADEGSVQEAMEDLVVGLL
jgi:RNA recognition motif-containing protein